MTPPILKFLQLFQVIEMEIRLPKDQLGYSKLGADQFNFALVGCSQTEFGGSEGHVYVSSICTSLFQMKGRNREQQLQAASAGPHRVAPLNEIDELLTRFEAQITKLVSEYSSNLSEDSACGDAVLFLCRLPSLVSDWLKQAQKALKAIDEAAYQPS